MHGDGKSGVLQAVTGPLNMYCTSQENRFEEGKADAWAHLINMSLWQGAC